MDNLQPPQPSKEQLQLIQELINTGKLSVARNLCEQMGIKHNQIVSEQTEKWLLRFRTKDETMIKLKQQVRILSDVEDIVLIVGETGTGKELIAQALHGNRKGKFIAVNCAAIPNELLESELFGHVKGSFTGATNDRTGFFQAAFDGTIFLDEIGELPYTGQAALLRAIQEQRIRKVGSNVDEPTKVRLVCATWHDLKLEVDEGKFRRDLYHRLSRVVLKTTPLKQRLDDVEEILNHLDTKGILGDATIRKIKHYIQGNGSGNVRELENMVRRAELFGEQEIGI